MPLVMRAAPWSAEAEAALLSAADGDIELIRAEVLQGMSVLWRVTGDAVGWLVTREEPTLGEFVLVAGAGHNAAIVVRHAVAIATAAGLSVRIHIRRAGFRRILTRLGFVERERVMTYGRLQ